MFDDVYIRESIYPGKIVGINENGSYTVKIFNTRYKNMTSNDIWLARDFPVEKFRELGFNH